MSDSDYTSQKDKLIFENVSLVYDHRKRQVTALDDLSFSIKENEFVCVLGPSGCGKSTILNLIAGFLQPTSGSIQLNDSIVHGPGADRGFVFQRHSIFPWKTVRENIEFGLRIKELSKSERKEIVNRYLEVIELLEFENSYPYELSVGMRQRVGIARAYANDPDILLMDEPFSSLDAQTGIRMQKLLLQIWTQNPKTVIFVTHDIDESIFLADRVLLLTSRPGKLKKEIHIDLTRPRLHEILEDSRYRELRKEVMESVFNNSTL